MLHARLSAVLFVALYLVGCTAHSTGQGPAPSIGNAWMEIDRKLFEENVRTLQARLSGTTQLCAVMKADAYGHGIALLMPSIVALNVPCVAIASNDEARTAREQGFSGRLIRVRTATPSEVEDALPFGLEELVGSLAHARIVSDIGGKHGRTIPLHLALDSRGMSRNGLAVHTAQGQTEALEILRLPHLKLAGLMTHFPVEEREDVLRVLATFKEGAGWLIENGHLDKSKLTLHSANSFATLEVPESHLDLVRVGGALYGDTLTKYPEFKWIMQFKSRVASVNSYPAGSTVSYDRTFTLKRDSKLANIPMGYSDGYGRVLSNRGHVLIRGQRCPIVGRVTMNTFMVDVTDIPEVQPGDEVVLFGKQGASEITREQLEQLAGTILVEMYTAWGNTNPRILKPE
jgi:alanine racemase